MEAAGLHASQPSYQPTVESLYLHTLVMDLLNAGNLTRVQIEIADGWFSSWCQEYALDAEHVQGKHLFFVDFGSAGGMRLMRGMMGQMMDRMPTGGTAVDGGAHQHDGSRSPR